MNVDIGSSAHKANPYPFYAQLRAESPVHRITLRDKRVAWLVTRYDDAVAVFRDERFGKDDAISRAEQGGRHPWIPAMFRPLTRNMLDVDEPDHGRLRSLINKAFTPRLVEEMRGRIESLANELLDAAAKSPRIDLIRDYALPIPTTIIAEMLSVPAGDRHRFQRWSRAIVSCNPSGLGLLRVLPHLWMFLRYVRRLIASKRGSSQDDLLTALVHAEESGRTLTEDELVAMAFLLLVAGHETTVNLIGNGTLALLQHLEQLDRLRNDPALIRPAVEELLRYESPLETASERYCRQDAEVAGTVVPRGALVFIAIASANRDERQFANPDVLDIARDPNRHLSFGLGAHYCVGAPLARLEGQIAVATLLRRAPGLRLDVPVERIRWRSGLVLRGLESLPLIARWS